MNEVEPGMLRLRYLHDGRPCLDQIEEALAVGDPAGAIKPGSATSAICGSKPTTVRGRAASSASSTRSARRYPEQVNQQLDVHVGV